VKVAQASCPPQDGLAAASLTPPASCQLAENHDRRQAGSTSAKTAKLGVLHFSLLSVSRIWQDAVLIEFESMEPGEPENGKRFFPSGAIFFFALLIVFYAALWLVIYWIMVARA